LDAKVFCFQHFRSAGITHLLERTGNLPGVMYIAGHRLAATTSKYVRPSLRAAEQVVGIVSGDQTRKGRKPAKS
jgi:hypothetical protein